MFKRRIRLFSGAAIAPFAFALAVFAPSTSEAVVLTSADGVIRNSLCTGFDCPNSPVFDDSTILLMENNTRIKFGDTSASPFPANDWEIEANSSLSGGASYLGINDCGTADNDGGCATDLVFAIEAGVRASALYVESDGDVGIGTSNPVLDVHVVTGNTPGIRLDQDGSSGFTPQVWDIAGNETNFFVRDATGGSTLPFRIQPGAPTNAIFVRAGGNVGIGTAAPAAALHVRRNTGAALGIGTFDNNGDVFLTLDNTVGNTWNVANLGGEMRLISPNGPGIEFRLTTAGALTITGPITTGGGTCGGGCDLVFKDKANIPSIEEHALDMWEHKYLPNVGPTVESAPFNVTDKVGRMLNELEKAHIYIEQLHTRLVEAENTIAFLRDLKADVEVLKAAKQ